MDSPNPGSNQDAKALDKPQLRGLERHLLLWVAAILAAFLLATIDGQKGYLSALGGEARALPYASVILLALALICEFVDATVGMGYGTTLTPVLILLGYPVRAIVPCAVLSQLAGNVSAVFFHHHMGNVDFLRDRKARNTALLMGGVGLAVAVGTVLLAVRIRAEFLAPLVTIMILALGVFLLAGSRLTFSFRWRNIVLLALVAAFNKSFTGGGYGPLVAGGQVLAGLAPRSAVATTALAEAVVCLATAGTYLVVGASIPVEVLLPLLAGAVLSTPASALALSHLPQGLVRKFMGLAVLLLGVLALARVVVQGL